MNRAEQVRGLIFDEVTDLLDQEGVENPTLCEVKSLAIAFVLGVLEGINDFEEEEDQYEPTPDS